MNISEEIEKLGKQRADGLITEEEFAQAKAKLMERSQGAGGAAGPGSSSLNVNQWSMFIHLSQLAGFVVVGAGFVLPIILWQMKKNESPIIDAHGKNVTNWLISALIYSLICAALIFVLIGFLLLPALAIAGVVFAIIGGLKANDGEVWKYPLTIQFFK